ncbi:MAG: penicillin-binding protein activator LpoB [Firmicutes bacterium]|nr:penicillin-binding protein activator LpoB [Bacillota bacterium]
MPMVKKGLLILILLSLIPAVGVKLLAAEKAPLIAILPFDDGSIQNRWWTRYNWDLGKGVTDMLVTELLAQKKFRLVEREMIDKVLQEQNFGARGRVDAGTAAKIGKILGVKYIVIGRITEFTIDTKGGVLGGVGLTVSTARVALDGRLVDTTTAEIIASVRGNGESKQSGLALSLTNLPFIAFGAKDFQESILGKATRAAITDFSGKLTEAVFGNAGGAAAPISGKVAAVSGNKVYLNVGANDGVTVGMVFTISRVIEEVKDPDTGEVIDLITEEVCEVTIGEVKDSSSNGTITAGTGKPQKGDLAVEKQK